MPEHYQRFMKGMTTIGLVFSDENIIKRADGKESGNGKLSYLQGRCSRNF
jgi:hypothetical protein